LLEGFFTRRHHSRNPVPQPAQSGREVRRYNAFVFDNEDFYPLHVITSVAVQ